MILFGRGDNFTDKDNFLRPLTKKSIKDQDFRSHSSIFRGLTFYRSRSRTKFAFAMISEEELVLGELCKKTKKQEIIIDGALFWGL